MSRSASKAPGAQKFVTWRVALPAPRTSTGTFSAGPYAGVSVVRARADGIANSPPAVLCSENVELRGT